MKRSGLWLVLVCGVLLWNLWGYDLWAPDEPYFAEGAREMIADGHWAVPHVNGGVTTDKPPLFFWLIALFSLPLSHVSSLTARLPSALAALGSVALTARLGRRLADARTGRLAGLILLSTYLFWDKSRTAQIDSLLCFLILAALSAFEGFLAGDADGRKAGLLFWLACSLAVIAKGPVGFAVPLGIAVTTLAARRDLGSWRRFAPFSGPLAFAALVGAWAVLATLGGGGEYSVWGALKEHALGRAVYGMHHAQPPWYYLEVMPLQLLPWTALLPAALLAAWKRRSPNARFLLVWTTFIFLFFSAITEKRELYLLPACPAIAILIAWMLREYHAIRIGRGGAPGETPLSLRWAIPPLRLTAVLLVATGIALPLLARRFPAAPTAGTWLLGACLLLTGIAAAIRTTREDPLPAARTLAVGWLFACLMAVTAIFPSLDSIKSARAFAETFSQVTAESRSRGAPVLAFRIGNMTDAMAFYSNGVYTEDATLDALERHLSRPDQVFALADSSEVEKLPREIRGRISILDSARFGPMKIILITNQAGVRAASSG